MSEHKFTLTRKQVKENGETWVRYDGYDGRFSVCITKCKSGYRYIQIFTYQQEHKLAPNMYVAERDITPFNVELELCYEARRYDLGEEKGPGFWEEVKAEMDLAFAAAAEIKERFIVNQEDLSVDFS